MNEMGKGACANTNRSSRGTPPCAEERSNGISNMSIPVIIKPGKKGGVMKFRKMREEISLALK